MQQGEFGSFAFPMRRALIVGCVSVAGCLNSGGLDLDLSLPSNPDLRPTGMTSISVVASSPTIGTLTNTSLLGTGDSFSAGDLPVGDDVQIDVLFRDDSSRLVGVGEASNLVDIVGDKTTSLSMPVRRPFVYASSGTTLYSYDPTLDARDSKFQGTLAGVTAPQLAVSIGGDRLVVASTNSLQVVETDTNAVTGSPISIPGTIHDAAPVPGTHLLAVAHSTGISIVDIDSGNVQTATGASVDRVTVGPTTDGSMVATGLVGRVAPSSSTEPCTGTSSLVTTSVTSPQTLVPMAQSMAIADVAASPDTNALYVALPCMGEVASVSGTTFTMVSMLSRAAVVTVSDQRVWAAGTQQSMAQCAGSGDTTVPCATGETADCTKPGANIEYVSDGAHLIVQSIPIGSGTAVEVDVPEPRETIISTDDPGGQHAQVLKSLAMTPVDLVALPGGQYVGLVTQTRYFIQSLVDLGDDQVILPCLDLATGDWQLLDMANTSVAERVRTQCALTIGPTTSETMFTGWACDDAPVGQQPMQGQYMPISVGALFGSR